MTTPPLMPPPEAGSTNPELDAVPTGLYDPDRPGVPSSTSYAKGGTNPTEPSPTPSDKQYRMPPGLPRPLYFYAFKPWVKLGSPILLFEYLKARFGDISHYNFLGTTIVFLNHPDYIREVLINQAPSFVKERTVRRMKVLLGEGLITSADPIHMRQRKIAAPAFHRQRIAAYASQIVAIAAAHTTRWQPGETIDIAAASMDLSLEIVARTLFDTEVTDDIRSINTEVNTIMDLYNFIIAFPKLESFLHLPIPGIVKFRRSRQRLDAIVNRLIRHRRAELEASATSESSSSRASSALPKSSSALASSVTRESSASQRSSASQGFSTSQGSSTSPEESTPPPDRGDLLSMLLTSRYEADGTGAQPTGMSDEQIRDEVLTIFLAGYETVANALTWTWYLLSQNPEAEARLHAELDTVLGAPSSTPNHPPPSPQTLSSRPDRTAVETGVDSEVERPASQASQSPGTQPTTHRLPTLADYPNLPYTEQVFAESMRLYPPAWAMGRMSTKPVTLGPYRIPAGAHFFFSQWMMGRSEAYFPEPLRFDPDRFTPENKAGRDKFAYFPFGGGGRQCIGESFAWMEGVLAMATIASRWRMRYTDPTPPTPQAKITLRPRDPLHMQLTPR